jgi:UDP-glucose 4-epimerase
MKYIVTGGCGFIGSVLVRRLSEEGHDVVVADNMSTGRVENAGGEIGVLKDIKDIGTLEGIGGVFHLGMPSSTYMFRKDPSLVGKTIDEFVFLLECCRKKGVKIVYASSSSLYNGNRIPFKEDMYIVPKDLYTETLYCMERLAEVYHDFFGVKSVGLRLFSVYGENERSKGRYANVVSQMMWAREEGLPFDVYDMGTTRDFIHVDDVVEAFLRTMESGVESGVINIGTGKAHSFREIIEAVGLENHRVVENPVKNYVRETHADTGKARKLLGFEAKTDVMDYIRARLSKG